MKHNVNTTANAAAVTVAVLYVICRLAVSLFPGLSMTVAQSWFHGIELGQISDWNLSVESFILGLFSTTAAAWITGYLFASLYNRLLKK